MAKEKKFEYHIILNIIILFLISSCNSPLKNGVSRDKIYVKSFIPLTGSLSKVGQSYQHGLNTALADFSEENKGFKREIVLETYDSGPRFSFSKVKEIIDETKTFAVLGFDVTKVPDFEFRPKVPVLDYWGEFGVHPNNFFKMRPTIAQTGSAIAEALLSAELSLPEPILFIKQDSAVSDWLYDAVNEKYPIPNYDLIELPHEQVSYVNYIRQAKNDGYQSIVSLSFAREFVILSTAMMENDFHVPLLIPSTNLRYDPYPGFLERPRELYVVDPLNSEGRKDEIYSQIENVILEKLNVPKIYLDKDATIRGYLTGLLFTEILLNIDKLNHKSVTNFLYSEDFELPLISEISFGDANQSFSFSLYEYGESSKIIKEIIV